MTGRRTLGRVGICVLMATQGLSGCVITQNTYERDGKTYGVVTGAFRARWYNYYERALSYMDGGFWEDAIADLQSALALRPTDQRRARTYGLHFIDYFPNRELGIARLNTHDIVGAIASLETSLSHVDSGRAEFYLNDANRQQMLARGVKDGAPPTLSFPGLDGSVRRGAELRLTGEIEDPGFVAEVRLNGRPLLLPVAQPHFKVDVPMHLQPGENELKVTATDLFGNAAEMSLQVAYDPDPPSIAVESIRDEPDGRMLTGLVEDASGVVALRVGGEPAKLEGKNGPQRFSIPATAAKLHLEAEDAAGNVAKLELHPALLQEKLAQADRGPPDITVGDMPAVVYDNEIFIDGSLWDAGGLASLSINDRKTEAAGKQTLYFRQAIPLEAGNNEVLIRATDADGQTSERKVVVERRIPPLRTLAARLSVVMAPFVASGEKQDATEAVETNLENAMVEQQRYHILDRTQVAALVTEWQLSASNLAQDGPDLLKLGEALSGDTTMLGWVKENAQSIEVYARLVDTTTGAILLEKDVFHEKKSLRNLRELLAGLGLKLKAALPLLEGKLASFSGDTLQVDMNDANLLPAGARLLLASTAHGDAAVAEVVGEARVEESDTGSLRATLLEGSPSTAMQVVTK